MEMTTLDNGVRIVSDARPHMHSAAVGLWLNNGARHQSPDQHGFAHFLEHLLFKGTETLDAQQLATAFERMGGHVNAETGRELTGYYGSVPGERCAELLQLLIDMLLAPRFCDADVAVECDVVLQEMAQVQDNPGEVLEEAAVFTAWSEHPLGWPILGEPERIRAADADTMHAYLRSLLQGHKIVVSACGAVDHGELVEACAGLEKLPAGKPRAVMTPSFQPVQTHIKRGSSQAHLIWLFPAPSFADERRATLLCANHMLGAGTTSRLYQEVREREGLVYGIDSALELYADTGLWSIQTSCDPADAKRTHALVSGILDDFAQRGASAEELATACAHMDAAYALYTDELHAQMERLAQDVFYCGVPRDPDQMRRAIAEVNASAVHAEFGRAAEQAYFGLLSPKAL